MQEPNHLPFTVQCFVTFTVDHGDKLLFLLSAVISHCSRACTSLHKMDKNGILSVEQVIKTVLFSTETRSVVVTHRRYWAHFQTQCASSFKTIHKLYNQLNNYASVGEGTSPAFIFVVFTVHWCCQSSAAKKPHLINKEFCNTTRDIQMIDATNTEVIWIYIHTKWQCCLNLQFKRDITECHLLNGLRNNELSFNSVWFSNEADFHLDSVANEQNVRF
jgi:hypothetical protein